MTFIELQQGFDSSLREILVTAGFEHLSAGTWHRRRGDERNVIHLQMRSSRESFCVNLGIHYDFLPKAALESPLDHEQIELVDCELRLRLTDQPENLDQWWPIATTSLAPVVELVRTRGLSIFDSYRLDGPIAAMHGKRIEAGDLGLLASMTKVRSCLLLARMHECLGNRDRSIEAAEIGIRLAGMAVGPKKALRDVLSRVSKSV